MGMLAPLYALAALAVVGPIIFHLIRRQPQGQMQFSSLMFLSPSPPRLTRRSRLDNLLLLLLRALAIVLIALAFARPYLRQESFLNSTLQGRLIVAILDTSGSMQRVDVWQAAQLEMQKLLDSLAPNDRIALYTIDKELEAVLAVDDENSTESAASQQTVRTALKTLRPTWHRTELAKGLKSIADLLSASAISGDLDPTASSEIVLVTDLHTDSRLESLQGYPWPESIRLDVRRVAPVMRGNASPSLMQASADDSEEKASESAGNFAVSVRVENDADSVANTLQLSWANGERALPGTSTTIQVPPGQVRVVPLGTRPSDGNGILLQGDAWGGDNTAFVVEPVRSVERIVYSGSVQNKPENDIGYFLARAPLDTELVRREVINSPPVELPGLLSEAETKVVVAEPTQDLLGKANVLRDFAARGGIVLMCLSRELDDPTQTAIFLDELLSVSGTQVDEAPRKDFALIADVDFQHPIFAPFSDPRFNDFGKIRIWSHRQFTTPQSNDVAVLAALDDESPLLLEAKVGTGRIWVLTCGWQPAASGLGLSSKFVPILMGLLDPTGRSRQSQFTYEVGDWIDVADYGDLTVSSENDQPVTDPAIRLEDQRLSFNEPGLFWLVGEKLRRQIAVQIPASESRLLPLDTDIFNQYGIPLGKVDSDETRKESQRQLQVAELESKQRLWQWLIVAGLVVLGIETVLAGLSNRGAAA